ncbi:MAG: thiamine phosphate synthase [Geobacteraceae bacterium]|nr:thiamine phosphate synthase [Geobacteraceae bacterium]
MAEKPLVDFSLYLITDRQQVPGGDLCAAVEGALRGGVRAVQLREKDLSGRELYQLACRLKESTARYGAKLFINDRLDIALAAGADGVHLGENSLPLPRARQLAGGRMLVGVSCHDRERALKAQEHGADFITFSPIYYTPSKAPYGEPVGTERLAEACRLLRIPVFALGGIKQETVREVLDHGAHGIALISAILAADDPERAAREMTGLLSDKDHAKG